ncbi:hypothetical protein N7448_007590 [Penicillium atrosanguineum]|uniref:Uncharacterized protein n=1 Tax=Penicillium atrosanguineum TaxID=1132637 RepID=A0A9W9KX65_9EURO|nr:hypothetical protein N7448_007590 [Penicillium atrosanguineum]KAJ5147018.1 hypothetical protein N7526_000370 [Penicillium atrosanguineum]KAJ5331671.1 hypothetical protein N7476_001454 [Penicillium atrosanguineum]
MSASGLVTVPILLAQSEDGLSTGTMLQIWHRLYKCGHSQNPKLAVVSSSAFAYLAWCASRTPGDRVSMFLFGAAASLVTGIVPFTLLFMLPTNHSILAKVAEAEMSPNASVQKPEHNTSKQLLAHWATLTGLRGLLPLVGGIVGLLAVLDR